jgi:hypothetical protein
MISLLAGIAVLLIATAIAAVGVLAGRRDDDLWLVPIGKPAQRTDAGVGVPWGRP